MNVEKPCLPPRVLRKMPWTMRAMPTQLNLVHIAFASWWEVTLVGLPPPPTIFDYLVGSWLFVDFFRGDSNDD